MFEQPALAVGIDGLVAPLALVRVQRGDQLGAPVERPQQLAIGSIDLVAVRNHHGVAPDVHAMSLSKTGSAAVAQAVISARASAVALRLMCTARPG